MPVGPLMISLIERAGPVMMPLCAGWRRGPAEGAERLQHDGQTAPGRRQQMVYTAETQTRLFYRTSSVLSTVLSTFSDTDAEYLIMMLQNTHDSITFILFFNFIDFLFELNSSSGFSGFTKVQTLATKVLCTCI